MIGLNTIDLPPTSKLVMRGLRTTSLRTGPQLYRLRYDSSVSIQLFLFLLLPYDNPPPRVDHLKPLNL